MRTDADLLAQILFPVIGRGEQVRGRRRSLFRFRGGRGVFSFVARTLRQKGTAPRRASAAERAAVDRVDRRAVRAAAAVEAEHAQRIENMIYRARVEAERAAREAEEAMVVEACRRDLDAFDNQQATLAFVQRVEASGEPLTGDTMAAEIQSCRDMVAD